MDFNFFFFCNKINIPFNSTSLCKGPGQAQLTMSAQLWRAWLGLLESGLLP